MLIARSLQRILDGEIVEKPALQILAFREMLNEDEHYKRYRLLLTDGIYYFSGFVLSNNLSKDIENGTLKKFTIITLNKFQCVKIQSRLKYIVIILQLSKIEDRNNLCFSKTLDNLEDLAKKSERNYILLNHLCSNMRSGKTIFDYTIKVKVQEKSSKIPWEKNELKGIFIMMKFQDDENNEINAVTFNEAVGDKIHINKMYYFTHFKPGKKRYDDKCQIIIDDETRIIPLANSTIVSDSTVSIKYSPGVLVHSSNNHKSHLTQLQIYWIKYTLIIITFAVIVILILRAERQFHFYLPGKTK